MTMDDQYEFNIKAKRPEETFDKASDYFRGKTLSHYATSKSMMRIQEKITIRALELLDLQGDALILDAGAGPGFSSTYLREIGFNVVAIDIISEFLGFYDIRELNPTASDMCFPPFRPNTFDAIISISAVQWVFRKINDRLMQERLVALATSFSKILKPNSKVIFQLYPKNNMIMSALGKIIADNGNLKGNFIIDNPNNPVKRRIYLLLQKN